MNEMVLKENNVIKEADILNDNFSFESKIEVAANVATTLKRVLHEQNLVMKIKHNEYVLAEGWNTLGTILGTYAKTVEVVPFESLKGKKGYKARVCIMKGENQLACAEAIDILGQNGRNDEAAVYSMAQTRAMGKAYRMAFSWIVKMAGFEPTPAEEMENVRPGNRRHNMKKEVVKEEPAEEDIVVVEKVEDKKDNVDDITVRNYLKMFYDMAADEHDPVMKGHIIRLARKHDYKDEHEREAVLSRIKELPAGIIEL